MIGVVGVIMGLFSCPRCERACACEESSLVDKGDSPYLAVALACNVATVIIFRDRESFLFTDNVGILVIGSMTGDNSSILLERRSLREAETC